MEKEEIISLFNLYSTLKKYAPKLESAINEKNMEKLAEIKREILSIGKSADGIL